MAEVVDTGQKRDTRGRRIERAEHRAAMIAAYEKSGLTQRAFAEREGVKFWTFTNWIALHRQKATKASFAEVSLKPPAERPVVEVALPNGLVVRGRDPEQLAAVVRHLR